MTSLTLTLRLLAVAFIGVAALHFFTGMQADAMLGVPITPEMAAQPSLDSQNRFYGISFSLLGVVLLLAVTDLRRYAPMVNAVLGVLFAAGVARGLAWFLHGAPVPAVVGILCADLLLPPLLHVWLRKTMRQSAA